MIRYSIRQLAQLGPLPNEQSSEEIIDQYEKIFEQIQMPVTDDEARLLCTLFGSDDLYGAAWTLLHLIESAPNWPLAECLTDSTNEWIKRLQRRVNFGPQQ